MRFIVNRNTWMRGTEEGSLLSDGCRCCLGFLCTTLGVPDNKLQDTGVPDASMGDQFSLPSWLVNSTPLLEQIISVNDYPCGMKLAEVDNEFPIPANEGERERFLTALFLEADINVSFCGGDVPLTYTKEVTT